MPAARCALPLSQCLLGARGLAASARSSWNLYQYAARRGFTVLGIESSCDDSSVAILHIPENGAPTLPFHGKVTADTRKFLGINPITAFQSHRRNLSPLLQSALPHLPDGRKPDIVAVTRGPGMISSLDVGLQTAKGLALAWDVPLVGINHMQAHALTVRLCRALEGRGLDDPKYPFLSLLVSGGHTLVVVSRSLTDHEVLAETIDTAVGDCVDKVGRAVVPTELVKVKNDTNYGRLLEEFAFPDGSENHYYASKQDVVGDELEKRYGWRLPVSLSGAKKWGHRGLMKFSFAGLRSSVDRIVDIRKAEKGDNWADLEERRALSQELMRRCWEHLASRLTMSLELMRDRDVNIKTVVVSGGVASNRYLRDVLRNQLDFHEFGNVELAFPPVEFCTDNAAMISWTGWEMYQAGYESTMDIAPFKKWSLQPLDDTADSIERDWEESAFGILGVSGWKTRDC
ncbi:hypothetical protein TWF696_001601 [Orbilia brochopaga]|uniref:N(6)-L-threonylcarbamoyladenine synthase n=1 Tax=Orbilia brochopaga TaxID=3140254 RepID=A0AAV9U9C3_9PEZI